MQIYLLQFARIFSVQFGMFKFHELCDILMAVQSSQSISLSSVPPGRVEASYGCFVLEDSAPIPFSPFILPSSFLIESNLFKVLNLFKFGIGWNNYGV